MNAKHLGGWSIFIWANALFIIYGSLFPFNFQSSARPWQDLLLEWNPFTNQADAVDNFLLFVPLGLGLCARFASAQGRAWSGLLSVMTLGVGLQYLQLDIPERTASLADVIWNTVGLLGGMLVHRFAGPQIQRLALASEGGQDKFAIVLLLLWLTYESFPFVPTLDIGLLREHIKSAVYAPPFELQRLVEHCMAALLGGMALMRLRLHPRNGLTLLAAGCVVLLLEVLVPYGALRRETMVGICLGLALSLKVAPWSRKQQEWPLLVLALLMYTLTILTISRGQAGAAGFTFTPFSALLWHSVTREIPPSAYQALALGSLIWAGFSSKVVQRSPKAWLFSVLLLMVLLELLRVFVMHAQGDTNSLAIVLVLFPFALAYSKAERSAAPTAGRRSGSAASTAQHSPAQVNDGNRILELAFSACVVGFTAYIAWTGHQLQTHPAWLAYWCLGCLALLAAPRQAGLGLWVFLLLTYSTSTNGTQYDIALKLRLSDGIALLSLGAWLLSPKQAFDAAYDRLLAVKFLAAALFLWLLLCLLIALSQGTPWGPFPRLDPSTYFQAAVFFTLAAHWMQERRQVLVMAAVACLAILGRAILLGRDGVHLESYTASLLVMAIPLAGLGALLARNSMAKLAFAATGFALLVYFGLTQNRNAGVAAAVMIAVFTIQAVLRLKNHKWRLTFLAGLLAVLALFLSSADDFVDRFSVLWNDQASHATAGLDQSTIQGRLALWHAAWEIAKDKPLFGVGPGNFPYWSQVYSAEAESGGARNSYLQMVAEAGFIGLGLYLLLFASVLRLQSLTQSKLAGQWQAHAAWMLQLSTIAYLALGLFNNRNDLVLAYMLAGSSLALYASSFKRHLKTAESPESPATPANMPATPAQAYAPVPLSEKIPSLDGLRGLACLLVFGVHFNQIAQVKAEFGYFDLSRFLENGNIGVALFFSLSGMLLSLPFWRAKLTGANHPDVSNYFINRIARILPAYYVCLLSLALLNQLWTKEQGIAILGLHLLMALNFTEWSIFAINPPFWTIAVEMQFYLLLPLVFFAFRRLSPQISVALFIGIGLLGYMLTYFLATSQNAVPEQAAISPILQYSLLAHLPHFILGILAARFFLAITENNSAVRRFSALISWFCLIATLLVMSTPIDEWLKIPYGHYNLPYIPILLSLLICTAPFAKSLKSILESAPLRILGLLSYGIYIYHLPILSFTAKIFKKMDYLPGSHAALFFLASISLTIVISLASLVFVESPFLRWKNKLQKRSPHLRQSPNSYA